MIDYQKLLSKIAASEKELKVVNKIVCELIDKIILCIKELNLKLDIEPMLVGSLSKGTCLKHPDIDIFLLFSKKYTSEELKKYGLEIGTKVLKNPILKYAEHPYTHAIYKGYDVDIVPCYKIITCDDKVTAVDRTPLHTKYIQKHMNEAQKKDTIILKQFLKGIGVYGAEISVEGFSGYLCELLILYYGSFENLLHNAVKWKIPTEINLTQAQHTKFTTPLVTIDPVDPNRNVSAALSLYNFTKFVYACNCLLEKPTYKFFFPKKPLPASKKILQQLLVTRKTEIFGIEINLQEMNLEDIHSQSRKCIEALANVLTEYEFKIINKSYFISKGKLIIIFELEKLTLCNVLIHQGPKFEDIQHAKNFIYKWQGNERAYSSPFVVNGRWYIELKRKFLNCKDLIQAQIHALNLGENINVTIKNKAYKLITVNYILKHYPEYLEKTIIKKFSWEL